MSGSVQVITVRVPLAMRHRAGRRIVITPDGCPAPVQRARIDSALVKALARAHRWKRLLESGRYASISEMAAAERIDRGYLGRILQLTLLAPDIVEAILNGRQPTTLVLPMLMEPFSAVWEQQRATLSGGVPAAGACDKANGPAATEPFFVGR